MAKAVVAAAVPELVPVPEPALVVSPLAVPPLVLELVPLVPLDVAPEPLLLPLPLLPPDEPAAVVAVLFDPPPPPHAAIVRTTMICTLRLNHRVRSDSDDAFPDRNPRITTSAEETPERMRRRASGSRAERHC